MGCVYAVGAVRDRNPHGGAVLHESKDETRQHFRGLLPRAMKKERNKKSIRYGRLR